jgi:hypothetical protein
VKVSGEIVASSPPMTALAIPDARVAPAASICHLRVMWTAR